jgi:demethylmenaquinone methyltransferase/2-methoxy-6-polyprenyl-1,4-benzoquinol methylase
LGLLINNTKVLSSKLSDMMKKNFNKFSKKSEIQNKYNITSEFYDKRYISIQQEKYNLVVDNLFLQNRIILDEGCGTGLLFEFLLDSYYQSSFLSCRYVAVDISINMLKEFQSKIKENYGDFHTKPFLILTDLENLPFRKNSFNLMFSFTSFQNLPDMEKGLEESFRVLSYMGEFFVSILKKKIKSEKLYNLLKPLTNNLRIIEKDSIEDIIFLGKGLKK